MRIVSEIEHTKISIKTELEQLYVAVSYVNADSGEIDLVVNLIAAAIEELDSVAAKNPPPKFRLVRSAE